jgi:hypothetical protein
MRDIVGNWDWRGRWQHAMVKLNMQLNTCRGVKKAPY